MRVDRLKDVEGKVENFDLFTSSWMNLSFFLLSESTQSTHMSPSTFTSSVLP